MRTEESLYVKILLWAYEKKENGFTQPELFDHFFLKDDLHIWVRKMFFERTKDDRPLIGHLISRDSKDFYALTEKGMSVAIDYLDLKEARESSKEAKRIALWSIWIAIFVGIFQIIIGFLTIFN